MPAQDGGVFTIPFGSGVIPRKHIIELTIDPARDTFTGWAQIEVELTKPTTALEVHAKDLTVLSLRL